MTHGKCGAQWPPYAPAYALQWVWLWCEVQDDSPQNSSQLCASAPYSSRNDFPGRSRFFYITAQFWPSFRSWLVVDVDHLLVAATAPATSLVLTTLDEQQLKKYRNEISCSICSYLGGGERFTFALNDHSVLFLSTNRFGQILLLQSLVACVLRLSHDAEMAGHTGERRLYQFLQRSFFWPNMSLDCYAVAQICISCAITG